MISRRLAVAAAVLFMNTGICFAAGHVGNTTAHHAVKVFSSDHAEPAAHPSQPSQPSIRNSDLPPELRAYPARPGWSRIPPASETDAEPMPTQVAVPECDPVDFVSVIICQARRYILDNVEAGKNLWNSFSKGYSI